MVELIITGVISLLGGGFLFNMYTIAKRGRKIDLENEDATISQWLKLYETSQKDSADKQVRIKELESEIRDLRDKNLSILTENHKLTLDMSKLLMMKCEVRGCKDRKPLNDY